MRHDWIYKQLYMTGVPHEQCSTATKTELPKGLREGNMSGLILFIVSEIISSDLISGGNIFTRQYFHKKNMDFCHSAEDWQSVPWQQLGSTPTQLPSTWMLDIQVVVRRLIRNSSTHLDWNDCFES